MNNIILHICIVYSDILKYTFKNYPSTSNSNNIIPHIISNTNTNLPSECSHSIIIEHVSQSIDHIYRLMRNDIINDIIIGNIYVSYYNIINNV